jgi:hypothetical protein
MIALPETEEAEVGVRDMEFIIMVAVNSGILKDEIVVTMKVFTHTAVTALHTLRTHHHLHPLHSFRD